jgi:CubicO group peptidase (beta-lactamase class C family)
MQALPATPEKLVAGFRDKPLDFEPGQDWNYSNSGYVLLGHLIERIGGESYEQFLQKNIFIPLGMQGLGIRLQFRHQRAARGRVRVRAVRAGERAVHSHDGASRRGGAVCDDGGPAALGAGTLRRQGALGCIAGEDDGSLQA